MIRDILLSVPVNIDISDDGSIGDAYDRALAIRKAYHPAYLGSRMAADDPRRWLGDGFEDNVEDLEDWELEEAGLMDKVQKGLPQGAAPSTILSLLALTD